MEKPIEIKEVPKTASAEVEDRDLRLAREGKLFDLESNETDIFYSKMIDYSERYGNELLRAENIVFDNERKGYVWWGHKTDREWFSKNQVQILNAITNPLYVDNSPRTVDRTGYNIANIFELDDQDLPYLNVVVNINSGKAKIWTMFRVREQYLFDKSGVLKGRWKKMK